MNEAQPHPAVPAASGNGSHARTDAFALTLGSVGVVYGDIGTSPLYAFREAVVAAADGGPVTREAVLGVLSLIVWALIIVVTLKYVLILLRADNNGEGGTLSLMALATRALGRRTPLVMVLGIIGSSMFLGDSVITPAISVLSAVEGLKLVTPAFEHSVMPVTVAILIALFAVQRRGTARVAAFFGPVMVVWFVAIAIAGGLHIHDDPGVLAAVNPVLRGAVRSMPTQDRPGDPGPRLPGGDRRRSALRRSRAFRPQADPVRLARPRLPALLINYFGQGARVLSDPTAIVNPFYRLVPDALLIPMVVLATAATVIASQAVITGAYSLVRQAIQLGLLPRLAIVHTSEAYSGQIYIPRVNTALLIGVLLLVGLFRTSSALASAYGIAVATTMVCDGLLGFIVVWKLWRWPLWQAALMVVPLVVIDGIFLSANMIKVLEGAWVPLLFGAAMVLLIITWQRGTRILAQKTERTEVPLQSLLRSLEKKPPHVVPGTAVFLTSDPGFRAHRAAAQPQAQQGAARAQRGPHDRHRRHAAGEG